uniref:Ribonuclease H-like domain-containing protein n=1 Tax=Tanacetum cinerariifolium TaxID=118510 RepID=A0A6L2KEX5_TANCI|nr:ribonuclease H-like domain-containing protein [Tanacetum cinerariifolium]
MGKNSPWGLESCNLDLEGSETLEQTFNRLQAIVSHLEFMDVEIKQDDLNQKFLTSLAPEWLMYTIMWRNRSDLDTMSLDDVYNHLKVYEPEVQKKSESNSQNMAFISLAKNSIKSGVQVVSVPPAAEVPDVSVPTSSGLVSTASPIFTTASVATPYARRKGKEKMVESKTPKKNKIQEQMDVQMARELEEEMARDAQRMNEQIAKDAEIARIHAE